MVIGLQRIRRLEIGRPRPPGQMIRRAAAGRLCRQWTERESPPGPSVSTCRQPKAQTASTVAAAILAHTKTTL